MIASGKRRFIAGAVCPSCRAVDTTILYRAGDQQIRACVACEFEERAPLQHVGRELPTRVNAPHRQSDHENKDDVSPVRIIEPRGEKKR